MSEEVSQFESAPEDEKGADASSQSVPKLMLVVGIIIMLLPAGIPLYFALGAESSDAIWLFALAGGVAVVNILLVYGLWRWVNSLSAEGDSRG